MARCATEMVEKRGRTRLRGDYRLLAERCRGAANARRRQRYARSLDNGVYSKSKLQDSAIGESNDDDIWLAVGARCLLQLSSVRREAAESALAENPSSSSVGSRRRVNTSLSAGRSLVTRVRAERLCSVSAPNRRRLARVKWYNTRRLFSRQRQTLGTSLLYVRRTNYQAAQSLTQMIALTGRNCAMWAWPRGGSRGWGVAGAEGGWGAGGRGHTGG